MNIFIFQIVPQVPHFRTIKTLGWLYNRDIRYERNRSLPAAITSTDLLINYAMTLNAINEDTLKSQIAMKTTDIPKESGIYVITHLPTKKKYIGSSKNIYRRISQHIVSLYNKKHHSYKLQNLFNSHGLGSFTFTVLELCSIEDLISREQWHIDSVPVRSRLNVNKRADGSDYLNRQKKRRKKNDSNTNKTTKKRKRKTSNTNKANARTVG